MNVQRSALLPYSAPQMYAVISDVNCYPEFLNWCTDVRVEEQSAQQQIAELNITYGTLKLSFTTVNTLTPHELIEMKLAAGPFKNLSGQWEIQALGEGACKVSLNMSFTFDNPMTHRLFAKVFEKAITAQVSAFEQRANQIYGI